MADHLEDHKVVPVHGRRAFLKRSAVAGLTVAYAVPLIETLHATDVSAATSPAPGCNNCTYTIGYYKQSAKLASHCATTQAALTAAGGSIVLGAGCSNTANTITLSSCTDVANLLTNTAGGCNQLLAQLTAAKLNYTRVSAACQSAIAQAIAAADAYICSHADVAAGSCTKSEKQDAAALAATLEAFNSGKVAGCPHCDTCETED